MRELTRRSAANYESISPHLSNAVSFSARSRRLQRYSELRSPREGRTRRLMRAKTHFTADILADERIL